MNPGREIAALEGVPYTEETRVVSNGLTLAYDAFGAPEAPPLLLVAGLGCQMIVWDERFCARIAKRGYRVIRFDNRDVGVSSRLTDAGTPNIPALFAAQMMGMQTQTPYTLQDMAADAVGLLDAIGIDTAHVVGVSLGGAIAQVMAIRWPQRLRTLTSIMSSPGSKGLPPPTPEALSVLMATTPSEPIAFRDHYANTMRVLRGPGHPDDEAADLQRAQRLLQRGIDPRGTARQLAAIVTAPSRQETLGAVRLPTLVIHGAADPLIPLEGGIATAAAIPGSRLKVIEGMGHALPLAVWPEIIDAIAQHAQ